MRDDVPQRKGTMPDQSGTPMAARPPVTLGLRILATTDLHMQLLGHDYVADGPVGHHGLAGLARLIKAARKEAEAIGWVSVLLDNGDTFQGNILGDHSMHRENATDHPGVTTCNYLRYDAIGVGNHDLDNGLDHLHQIANALDMPLISTNLNLKHRGKLQKSTLIRRAAPDGTTIRIGLISVLPEHTAIWNSHVLGAANRVLPAVQAIRTEVAHLRSQGADVIVLMAHAGIEQGKIDNAAHLARIDGIDALIAGHTHRRFPGRDHRAARGVDPVAGMLAGRPAIMPGHHGSDLGVLDLLLERDKHGAFHVSDRKSTLRTNGENIQPDKTVTALCQKAHDNTRKRLRHPVGSTPVDLHNYFSLAMPTPTGALVARAQALAIRAALAGTPEADLPLVSAVSAQTAGGLGGPMNYLHIPPGPILRRHIAGLVPYADQVWAIKTDGDGLRRWLEHAARIYTHLRADAPEQNLVDRTVPPFTFDTIHGLNYVINPMYRHGSRIHELTFEGKPVAPSQPFILATNQFRAAGGGGYILKEGTEIVHRSPTPIKDVLQNAVENPLAPIWSDHPPWRLSCGGQVKATLETAPAVASHLKEAAHMSPRLCGKSAAGFALLELTL